MEGKVFSLFVPRWAHHPNILLFGLVPPMHHSLLTFFDFGALYLWEILLQEDETDVELSTHDLIHQVCPQVVFLLQMYDFHLN